MGRKRKNFKIKDSKPLAEWCDQLKAPMSREFLSWCFNTYGYERNGRKFSREEYFRLRTAFFASTGKD